jgi:hypothetical protein
MEISKIELDLYSFDLDLEYNKLITEPNYIGSIPLIIGEIKYFKDSILIKFPSNFFLNEKYFSGLSSSYKIVINSDIKFKNISLQYLMRLDDSCQRRIIAGMSRLFTEFNYLYTTKSTNLFTKSIINNQLSFEKLINKTEQLIGIYLSIPIELVGLLINIEIKIKNNLVLIDFDILENKYKIGEKGFVNLYKVDFENNNLNLEDKNIKFDLSSIKFNFNLEDKNLYEHINLNTIYIYPIVKNKLICTNLVPRLKYLDGNLNSKFTLEDNEKIIKYSNNIDLLIKDSIKGCQNNGNIKGMTFDDYFYDSVRKYLS